MKNIHLIPTDKPTGLFESQSGVLHYSIMNKVRTGLLKGYHIYITSDEEIKDVRPHKGKWQLEKGQILNKFPNYLTDLSDCKLVIMTTDPDLIADGVQAIDDEFLEWFVKNPSCEEVEVENSSVVKEHIFDGSNDGEVIWEYKIIIPKEERERGITITHVGKQETLGEAAEEFYSEQSKAYEDEIEPMFDISRYLVAGFIDGAKWKAERMYSEEEVINILDKFLVSMVKNEKTGLIEEWFEQFKKK